MAIITIRDPKTGAIRRQVDTRTNTFVSTGTSSPPPSSQQTSTPQSTANTSSRGFDRISANLDLSGKVSTIKVENPRGEVTTTIRDARTGRSRTFNKELSQREQANVRREIAPKIEQQSKPFQQRLREIQQEARSKALRPTIVDARTGRVIQQGNAKVDIDFETRRSNIRREQQRRQEVVRQGLENIRQENINIPTATLEVANKISPAQTLNKFIKGEIKVPDLILSAAANLGTPRKTDTSITQAGKGIIRGVNNFVVSPIIELNNAIIDRSSPTRQVRTPAQAINKLKSDITRLPLTLSLTGATLGRKIQSNNIGDRAEVLTSFALLFAGVRLPTGSTKGVFNSKYDTVVNIGRQRRGVTIPETYTTNVRTGGITNQGLPFKQSTRIRFNPSTNKGTINIKGTEGKKPFSDSFSFRRVGNFFVNEKTGQRISGRQINYDNARWSIDEIQSRRSGRDIKYSGVSGGINIKQTRDIISRKIRGEQGLGLKGVEGVRVKTSQVELTREIKKAGNKVKPILRDVNILSGSITGGQRFIPKKKPKSPKVTEKDLEKFLKAIGYDETIILGLDRRGRVARALGLRKDSSFVRDVDRFLDSGTQIRKKGRVRLRAEQQEGMLSFNLGVALQKYVPSPRLTLRESGINLSNRNLRIPDVITQLRKANTLRLRNFIAVNEFRKAITQARTILQERLNVPVNIKVDKTKIEIQPQKKIPQNKQTQLKSNDQVKILKAPQVQKTKPKTPKTPRKMSKARVIKLTKPKTPKVLRIPRVDLNAPKKGSRQGYIIQVKEGNRIVSKSKTPLPLNRAKRLGKRRVDNTLAASFDLVPKGKTPITDIKTVPLGRKFRTRRGKDPKVRRFVEKKRFRLDSPTEKRELQRRRKAAKKNK